MRLFFPYACSEQSIRYMGKNDDDDDDEKKLLNCIRFALLYYKCDFIHYCVIDVCECVACYLQMEYDIYWVNRLRWRAKQQNAFIFISNSKALKIYRIYTVFWCYTLLWADESWRECSAHSTMEASDGWTWKKRKCNNKESEQRVRASRKNRVPCRGEDHCFGYNSLIFFTLAHLFLIKTLFTFRRK